MDILLMFGINKFEVKTMKYYHNLYSKFDVLLLADVFEKARNNNLKNYGLCLSHCLWIMFKSKP